MIHISINTMPANSLAPLSSRTFAGTFITKLRSQIHEIITWKANLWFVAPQYTGANKVSIMNNEKHSESANLHQAYFEECKTV